MSEKINVKALEGLRAGADGQVKELLDGNFGLAMAAAGVRRGIKVFLFKRGDGCIAAPSP